MQISLDTQKLHPTTFSCIEALQWLYDTHHVRNVLDMGCGDGILGLSAASLWKTKVLAVDISEMAVRDTLANITTYHMGQLVTALRSDGFNEPLIAASAPYDLIIFNMLAEQAIRMAPMMQSMIAPEGFCIISGVLSWLGADVEAAYAKLGFTVEKTISHMQWQTYVMQSKGDLIVI